MEKFVYGENSPMIVEGQDSVDFESISLIYKISLFFYLLAVIILVIERIYWRLQRRKEENNLRIKKNTEKFAL